VRDAPLEARHLAGEAFHWYRRSAVTDLRTSTFWWWTVRRRASARSRDTRPFPSFVAQFAERAVIVVDDIDRADERPQTKRWLDGLRASRTRVAGHTSSRRAGSMS
jgi:hypothetical protein